jgi:hydrogenase maturation protease
VGNAVNDAENNRYGVGARLKGKRFGVVGVGNVLKGDDGAGPALVALLASRGARFPFVDACEVPENYGGWVAKQGLDAVVFVDAVDFGGVPGGSGASFPSRISCTRRAARTGCRFIF